MRIASLCAAVLLVGCSSGDKVGGDEERNAAELYKDTSVCVINDSSSRTQVAFTLGDNVSEDKILWENMGDKACGSGSNFSHVVDVQGEFLTTNPDRTWFFATGNRAIRAPGINVGYRTGRSSYICIGQEFAENESKSFDDGFVTVTAKRLPDTSVKNFEVRITDTTNPSTSGEARTC